MKRFSVLTAVLVASALAAPASAGDVKLNGPHYNLNIIGKDKAKSSTMTDSERHTIFVPLNNKGEVASRIYLTPGDFRVCDGNAFDAAHDCAGKVLNQTGAVFQLPCNTANLEATPCAEGSGASYSVWGRALGKPGGKVTMTNCATDSLTGELVCDTANAVGFERKKGKSDFVDVTKQLTALNACITINGVTTCQTLSLFDPLLEDYFWLYDNNGLRLLQLRFYPQ